jgi:C_GCAxxG_C_C family probable redox protein
MNTSDRAELLFRGPCNCCQAVFGSAAPGLGLDEGAAIRLGTAFGGGMGRMGGVCGAVTGAFLVLGLKYGDPQPVNESKERIYGLVRRFVEEFGRLHGSIYCRDLLGCEIGTPEGMAEAKEKGLFDTICVKFVRNAVDIAGRL